MKLKYLPILILSCFIHSFALAGPQDSLDELIEGASSYALGEHSKAAELFDKACKGNNEEACHMLGVLYADGKGVQQNKAKAAELWEKACASAHPSSCILLGSAYYIGDGVKKDAEKAKQLREKSAELFEKSCNDGDALNCKNLAFLYYMGAGVKRDKAKATQLFEKACNAGDIGACVFVPGFEI